MSKNNYDIKCTSILFWTWKSLSHLHVILAEFIENFARTACFLCLASACDFFVVSAWQKPGYVQVTA